MTRQKVDVIPASVRSVQNGGQLKSQTNIRVAAYCRVSTGDESQQTSYTTQKAFYKDLITRKPGWIFAGIYADATVIIGLKQNPTYGRRFSPIFLFIRAFCGAKRKMLL